MKLFNSYENNIYIILLKQLQTVIFEIFLIQMLCIWMCAVQFYLLVNLIASYTIFVDNKETRFNYNLNYQFSSVLLLFATPCTTALQVSLFITNSQGLLKLMALSQWCHPTISSSVVAFSSRLQSFPASGSFQISQFFASGGQSIGVSASTSVLPMNIQDWFPLGWTGWISLQSKGLSRVFSNTTVQKHQFFAAQLSLY